MVYPLARGTRATLPDRVLTLDRLIRFGGTRHCDGAKANHQRLSAGGEHVSTVVTTWVSGSQSRSAGAGNTGSMRSSRLIKRRFIRWRGEHLGCALPDGFRRFIRWRGKLQLPTQPDINQYRDLSAGAGNTMPTQPILTNIELHPAGAGNTSRNYQCSFIGWFIRWRGETLELPADPTLIFRFIPLARGTRRFAFLAVFTGLSAGGEHSDCHLLPPSVPVYPLARGTRHRAVMRVDKT